jgi:hypothetical protein
MAPTGLFPDLVPANAADQGLAHTELARSLSGRSRISPNGTHLAPRELAPITIQKSCSVEERLDLDDLEEGSIRRLDTRRKQAGSSRTL